MDSTLYELKDEWLEILALAEDEEVEDQVIEDMLEALGEEFEEKAENIARVREELLARAERFGKQEKRCATNKRVAQNRADYLKNYLEMAMRATGKTKFRTELFTFGIQKNGGKLPVILDVDCSELPDELVTLTPKMADIGLYIEQHPESNIAHFGERGESLRIR